MTSHEQLSSQGFQVTHDNPQFFYNFIRGQERFITNPTPEQLDEWLQLGSAVWDRVEFQNLGIHEPLSSTQLDGDLLSAEYTNLDIGIDLEDKLKADIKTTVLRSSVSISSSPFYSLEVIDQVVENIRNAGVISSARFNGIRSRLRVNGSTLGSIQADFGNPGFIDYTRLNPWYFSSHMGRSIVESTEQRRDRGVGRIYFSSNLPLENEANFQEALINFARNYQLLLTALYEVESKAPPPVSIHLKAPSALTTQLKLD